MSLDSHKLTPAGIISPSSLHHEIVKQKQQKRWMLYLNQCSFILMASPSGMLNQVMVFFKLSHYGKFHIKQLLLLRFLQLFFNKQLQHSSVVSLIHTEACQDYNIIIMFFLPEQFLHYWVFHVSFCYFEIPCVQFVYLDLSLNVSLNLCSFLSSALQFTPDPDVNQPQLTPLAMIPSFILPFILISLTHSSVSHLVCL